MSCTNAQLNVQALQSSQKLEVHVCISRVTYTSIQTARITGHQGRIQEILFGVVDVGNTHVCRCTQGTCKIIGHAHSSPLVHVPLGRRYGIVVPVI